MVIDLRQRPRGPGVAADARGSARAAPNASLQQAIQRPVTAQRSALLVLQSKAGNQAVARAVQRHPRHAPEEEDIQRRVVQRHPQHAPEEEDIQRTALQRFETKKSLKKRMEKEYGTPFAGTIPKSMLKRLDKILSKLPRSHTAGNAALQAITLGGIGGNASAYDSDSKEIEINRPSLPVGEIKMPWWLYLLLDKGVKWQRRMMDEGAMSDFDVDADADPALGRREVMAGVSDVLAREKLVDWTIRHEMGHSIDQQIQFMRQRGSLAVFGGWRMHDNDREHEVATSFLHKAGFSDQDLLAKISPAYTLLDKAAQCLLGKVSKLAPNAATIAPKLGRGADLPGVQSQLAAYDTSVALAASHPWTFSNGGGDTISHDGRTYHRDHYGTWVSYLTAARGSALSNYQFSSPGEWFAESYAAYYDPKSQSPARDRMPDDVRKWFAANLGPPPSSRDEARASTGNLVDDQGQLGTLKDLDEQVAEALNDPTKTATVKSSSLPEDLQELFA